MASIEQILGGIMRIEAAVARMKGDVNSLRRQQFRLRACLIIQMSVILVMIGFFLMSLTPESVQRICAALEFSQVLFEALARMAAIVGVISFFIGGSMFWWVAKKNGEQE